MYIGAHHGRTILTRILAIGYIPNPVLQLEYS